MPDTLTPAYPSGFSTRDLPMFRFTLGKTEGVAYHTAADRVGVSLNHISSAVTTSMAMTADEARALANALYQAADAAENVLPTGLGESTVTA